MKRFLLVISLWATAAALTLVGAQDAKPLNLAPYFPTPTAVVKAMLELGELKPGELLYDLGSGDGRIVIMAAQQFGARAVGFEIDPKLVYQSRERIEKRKLGALASIEGRDLMSADFSKPDLITVYLLPSSNDKIQPLLEDQVKSGARIVSHDFTFRGWEIEKEIVVEDPTDEEIPTHKLFLYRR
jgi:SAM-dependent methyltransferase